jgi:hypothetical protein
VALVGVVGNAVESDDSRVVVAVLVRVGLTAMVGVWMGRDPNQRERVIGWMDVTRALLELFHMSDRIEPAVHREKKLNWTR